MPDQATTSATNDKPSRPKMFSTLEQEADEDEDNINNDHATPEEQLEKALQDAISSQQTAGDNDDHKNVTSEPIRHKRLWTEYQTVNDADNRETSNEEEAQSNLDPKLDTTLEPPSDEAHEEQTTVINNVQNLLGGAYDDSDEDEEPQTLTPHDTNLMKDSLTRLGVKNASDQNVPFATVSATQLRDSNWEYNANVSNANSTASLINDFAKLQRQRHQIGWLAASAMQDADRILEMSGRMKEAKRTTRAKYGW